MCILFVYTLLKVVSHYDLSVLSMLVMGFQKNLDRIRVRSIQHSLWICFNFAKPFSIVT